MRSSQHSEVRKAHCSRQRIPAITSLKLRFLAASMTLLRYALLWPLLSLCFDSAASTPSSLARRQNDVEPEQQLFDVDSFCSEFALDGSMLTAFCSLKVIIPLVASVDLNGCIENASGDLLFAVG